MHVAVIGLGKLGTPLLAAIASRGISVTGVDKNTTISEALGRRESPVKEAGVQEILDNSEASSLISISSIEDAVKSSDILFIVVPTPSLWNGLFSSAYVEEVAKSIGSAMQTVDGNSYKLFVLVSTVMPGETERVLTRTIRSLSPRRQGRDYGICYNPEFIALGSVIQDILYPDCTIIGQSDEKAGGCLEQFYRTLHPNKEVPIARMSFVEAEIAKLSVNCYLTMKISYANLLAELCEQFPGANVDTVTGAVGLDSRIGTKYLKGATAYGGPCFPRDTSAMKMVALGLGLDFSLVAATESINNQQTQRLADIVCRRARSENQVGILGRSYKTQTDVEEKSAGVELQNELKRRGRESFLPLDDEPAQPIVDLSDIVVIMLPDPKYKELNFGTRTVIDCWRIFEKSEQPENYVAIGVGL